MHSRTRGTIRWPRLESALLLAGALLSILGLTVCGRPQENNGRQRATNAEVMLVARGTLEGHVEPTG